MTQISNSVLKVFVFDTKYKQVDFYNGNTDLESFSHELQ